LHRGDNARARQMFVGRWAADPLFFRQPLAPIFSLPAQAGYGDKRPS
jgi:hypothetical protein